MSLGDVSVKQSILEPDEQKREIGAKSRAGAPVTERLGVDEHSQRGYPRGDPNYGGNTIIISSVAHNVSRIFLFFGGKLWNRRTERF